MRFAVTLLSSAALAAAAAARLDWGEVTNRAALQTGQQTLYGQDPDPDHQGACSLSENAGNFSHAGVAWTRQAHMTLALNRDQLDGGRGCGMCVIFRAKAGGGGAGMTPLPEGVWLRGIVSNECNDPGCDKGATTSTSMATASGRCETWRGWGERRGGGNLATAPHLPPTPPHHHHPQAEWFAVPCDVGNTPFQYKMVASNAWWFALVAANHAVPLDAVSAQVAPGGPWVPLRRSTQNQWEYSGTWDAASPMRVRLTSVTGETVDNVIPARLRGCGPQGRGRPRDGPPTDGWPADG